MSETAMNETTIDNDTTIDPDGMTVEEARQYEQETKAHLDELNRLVRSGEDMTAVRRIPAAKDAAELAGALLEGVESLQARAEHDRWAAEVEQLRDEFAAYRDESDAKVKQARHEAAEAVRRYVETLEEADGGLVEFSIRGGSLKSKGEQFTDRFQDVTGRIRIYDDIQGRKRSHKVVTPVLSVVAEALRSVAGDGGGATSRREQQIFQLVRAFVNHASGDLQQLLRVLPGTLGHIEGRS
jgi:hypothetical protein